MLRPLMRAAVASLLLLWPLAAAAVAPATVTEVDAAYDTGTIIVAWGEPAEGAEDIARYRIYYSHESILENDGMYDDFVTTDAPVTSFEMVEIPPFPRVYVSVLAVNGAGEESATFGDEAMVEIPASEADASSSDAASSIPSSDTPVAAGGAGATEPAGATLQLLAAQGLTETGILLTFSQPVTIAQETAADAFRVLDASGAVLPIKTIVVQGPYVTLTTEPQRMGIRYNVAAFLVTGMALLPGQQPLVLDPRASTAAFTAGEDPLAAQTEPPLYAQASSVTLGLVRLRDEAAGKGKHTVFADFDAGGATTLLPFIEVLQSTDGGITYGEPQRLPAEARTVRFDGVPSGTFTLLLRSRTYDGQMTQSLPASILLAGNSTGGTSDLANSGAGALAAFAAAGAIAGWRKMRRKGEFAA